METKKTPLYNRHVELGGKIVDFAGYLLPIQYPAGILAEHRAVREAAGVFDVSHMGEVILNGPNALADLNRIMANDFSKLRIGRMRYTPMCYDDGGTVDDLVVARLSEDGWFLVVNASNKDKDLAWIKEHISPDTELSDVSEHIGVLALQGPNSQAIMERLADATLLPTGLFRFSSGVEVSFDGAEPVTCMISQSGYTGEHGYELYCPIEDTVRLWDMVLAAGEDLGLIPCGLGARDTLRLEAGLPLYGHELSADITPLEAGLSWTIRFDKEKGFIGATAMQERYTAEPRNLVALKVSGRGIVRPEQNLLIGDTQVGFTLSGTMSPTLGYAIATALVTVPVAEVEQASADGTLAVDVRGRRIAVEVTELPFYKRG
ncbi:MAG: glycine cleavage system aminomethyltransferase GcvT [Clostridiaceae bacterium]|nr:glycine cleavage system aminomethyltransferase GcvT [Clostridiaceae bacterium]